MRPPGMLGVGARPLVPHPQRPSIQCVVAVELADPGGKTTLDRRVQVSRLPRGRPPDTPEPGPRIEKPQRDALHRPVPGKLGRGVVIHDGEVGQQRPHDDRGAESRPLRAVRIPVVGELAVGHPPRSVQEVEVPPAVLVVVFASHVTRMAAAIRPRQRSKLTMSTGFLPDSAKSERGLIGAAGGAGPVRLPRAP